MIYNPSIVPSPINFTTYFNGLAGIYFLHDLNVYWLNEKILKINIALVAGKVIWGQFREKFAAMNLQQNFLVLVLICLFQSTLIGQITVLPSGDVGVSTIAPLTNLHIQTTNPTNMFVQGADGATSIAVERTNGGPNNQGAWFNMTAGANNGNFIIKNDIPFNISHARTEDGPIDATYQNLFRRITILGNGRIGIGVSNPSEKLHVSGNILATGTITPSDRRLKFDILDCETGLEDILALRPVSFKYNGLASTIEGDKHLGLIAQEVDLVIPALVSTQKVPIYEIDEESGAERFLREDEYMQIKDSDIKYVLINAIKDLARITDSLETETENLRLAYEEMTVENEKLKKELTELRLLISSKMK